MFRYLCYSFYLFSLLSLLLSASSDFSDQNVTKILTEKSPHETSRPTTKSPDLSGENATANITDSSGFYTQNSFPPNTALDSLTLQPVLNSSLVLLSPSKVTHFNILIFCEHNYNSAYYYMLHFLVKTSAITK